MSDRALRLPPGQRLPGPVAHRAGTGPLPETRQTKPQALSIQSQIPFPNEINASRVNGIEITFGQNVDEATIPGNVIVRSEHRGQATFTPIVNGPRLILAPDADFEEGEQLTVMLTAGLRDTIGQPLSEPTQWQFFADSTGSDGTFTDMGQSLGFAPTVEVGLADVDGDGDLDAICANSDNAANKLWLNNGSGIFTDSGRNLGNGDTRGMDLGDLDGDGDLDMYAAQSGLQPNEVYLNDGNGSFTDSGQRLASNRSEDVDLGDIDGDGDLDAFVVNDGAPHEVLLNDGSGTFTSTGQDIGAAGGGTAVTLGDMDNDGDIDPHSAPR